MSHEPVFSVNNDKHTSNTQNFDRVGTLSASNNVSRNHDRQSNGKTKQTKVKNIDDLNTLFGEIVRNTAIDYKDEEIQDIQDAVWDVLAFVKTKINQDGHFKITRIEPCGSMTEKSSLWKRHHPNISFIEFDFLAVLEKRNDYKIVQGCSGCMRVDSLPVYADGIVRQRYDGRKSDLLALSDLENDFHKKVGDVLFRCICESDNCRMRHAPPRLVPKQFGYHANDPHERIWFTVEKPTGKLLASNWLTWKWKSLARSLYGSNIFTSQQTLPVKELGIYIDLVPAIDLEHGRFIVTKLCTNCFHGWRISGCMAEIDQFLWMSESHINCYRVLKYLYQFKNVYGQNYIMKTAVLNHVTTCKSPQNVNSCAKCVFEILHDLGNAYRHQSLKAYGREVDLLQGSESDNGWSEKGNRLLLSALSNFKSWDNLKSVLGRNISGNSVKSSEWQTMEDPDVGSVEEILKASGSPRHLPTETRLSKLWCALC